MVDTPGEHSTVDHMTTTTAVTIALLVLLTGAGVTTLLRRRATRTTRTDPSTGHAPGAPEDAASTAERPRPRDPRIGRVAQAYADGAIDERTIGTAARILGIDKDEARRRLEAAATADTTSGTTGGNGARRPVDRAKKRKKNKQARRSRQTNRR